jgi:diguanylate cyclase (GGDEF)-like protein
VDELLAHEIQRCARYGSSLSVLLIDIDRFKRINDSHGHAAGDAVLQRLAGSLRLGVRSADVIGRYGGEEILVVLPQTPPDRALRTAERLLEIVRALTFRTTDAEFRVTVSIGVSGWEEVPADRKEQSRLVRRADRALYEAKRAGRDRARMWTPE